MLTGLGVGLGVAIVVMPILYDTTNTPISARCGVDGSSPRLVNGACLIESVLFFLLYSDTFARRQSCKRGKARCGRRLSYRTEVFIRYCSRKNGNVTLYQVPVYVSRPTPHAGVARSFSTRSVTTQCFIDVASWFMEALLKSAPPHLW